MRNGNNNGRNNRNNNQNNNNYNNNRNMTPTQKRNLRRYNAANRVRSHKNDSFGIVNRNKGGYTEVFSGRVGDYKVLIPTDSSAGTTMIAKIPLHCRNVPRISKTMQQYQKYEILDMSFKLTSSYGNTAGGSIRYGMIADPMENESNYEVLADKLSSTKLNRVSKIAEYNTIKFNKTNFTGGAKYTSLGQNPRYSNYGFFYVIIENFPTSDGSMTIDVTTKMRFTIPSLEGDEDHNLALQGEFSSIEGKAGVYIQQLLNVANTAIDVTKYIPGLDVHDGAKYYRTSVIGRLLIKDGAGNDDDLVFNHLYWHPSDQTGQYFTPVYFNDSFGYTVNTDKAQANKSKYQVVFPRGTTLQYVGRNLADIGSSDVTPVTPQFPLTFRGEVVDQSIDNSSSLGKSVEPRTFEVPETQLDKMGPGPPTYPVSMVYQPQMDEQTQEITENTDADGSHTRTDVNASRTAIEASVAGVDATVIAQGAFTRETVRLRTDALDIAIAGFAASSLAETGACVSKLNEQEATLNSAVQTQGTMDGKIDTILDKIKDSEFYDVVRDKVSTAQFSYGINNSVFLDAMNALSLIFSLDEFAEVKPDLILPLEKLQQFIRTGHLFGVNGSSDVPGLTEEHAWPDTAALDGDNVTGLYFRTQYANVVEDYPVYTYFRIDTYNDGGLYCTEHTPGEEAKPMNTL